MKSYLLTLLVVVTSAMGATPCFAGLPFGRCTDPVTFEDAEVNVIVLPYVDETASLSETAQQLTILLQQQLLLQVAPYGDVGIVRLSGDRDECDLMKVRRTLLARYPHRPGQALVFVSGHFFRADDEVRVQSSVTLVRRGGFPSFDLEVEGIHLSSEIPQTSLALMPRTLSRIELDSIAENFRKNARVYEQPTESAPSRPLADEFAQDTHYSVIRCVDGWMQIDGSAGAGWLRAVSKMGPRSLAERLPDIFFLEAVVGSFRSLPWRTDAEQQQRSTNAENAAARFALEAGDDDEQAIAWLETIRASIVLSRPGSRGALLDAKSHLDRAVELTPEDANTRTMRAAVLSKMVQEGVSPAAAWRQAKKDLLVATAHGGAGGRSLRFLRLLSGLNPAQGWSIQDQKNISEEQQELSRLYSPGNETPEAGETFRSATASLARRLCLVGDVESGVAQWEKLLAETGEADFIYHQARCYQQNARPADAIVHFQEYLRLAKDISPEERAAVERLISENRDLQTEKTATFSETFAMYRRDAPVDRPSPFYKSYWFLGGVAAAIVTGTVTAIVLSHNSSSPCDGINMACRGVK